jgi:hypothetical protein
MNEGMIFTIIPFLNYYKYGKGIFKNHRFMF